MFNDGYAIVFTVTLTTSTNSEITFLQDFAEILMNFGKNLKKYFFDIIYRMLFVDWNPQWHNSVLFYQSHVCIETRWAPRLKIHSWNNNNSNKYLYSALSCATQSDVTQTMIQYWRDFIMRYQFLIIALSFESQWFSIGYQHSNNRFYINH